MLLAFARPNMFKFALISFILHEYQQALPVVTQGATGHVLFYTESLILCFHKLRVTPASDDFVCCDTGCTKGRNN